MENKHTAAGLAQLQSLPLEAKITLSKKRIKEWYDYWDGEVYVSFSGGKDSTVLKHLVETTVGVWGVPSVFVDTGLEYPEIRKFAMSQPNVVTVRPEMRFDEVLRKYGYPVVSKAVSHSVKIARRNPKGKVAQNVFNPDNKGRFGFYRWAYLINARFWTSDECCNVMKKAPANEYSKKTGQKPILGTLAVESSLRYSAWLKHGCNAFEEKTPTSQPISFWTEQDVLHYIKKFDLPYCSVYGEIKQDKTESYYTTGCDRTGCMFCMFGCHLEKEPNRFQRLKETHPKQWQYCIGGGEFVDGVWQPNKQGLGLGYVLDYIGVKYE